ncbi:hypothetical protein EDEG_03320 [Edhazardia aedis USNM 41457]|uniref:Uncharacterized protein n=1 Tax=Edhazardia aedis (strain USNM 41457) TaxID=1003232 RepID=J9D333_EDHAE|nr:hypothetical protein EDEG_03320 [Edhazardia aedis USNM 41457]|eukprot:EJW02236.1 hypothetical protein EDEG_03320 [Edhazardia aedis USNM 41457]
MFECYKKMLRCLNYEEKIQEYTKIVKKIVNRLYKIQNHTLFTRIKNELPIENNKNIVDDSLINFHIHLRPKILKILDSKKHKIENVAQSYILDISIPQKKMINDLNVLQNTENLDINNKILFSDLSIFFIILSWKSENESIDFQRNFFLITLNTLNSRFFIFMKSFNVPNIIIQHEKEIAIIFVDFFSKIFWSYILSLKKMFSGEENDQIKKLINEIEKNLMHFNSEFKIFFSEIFDVDPKYYLMGISHQEENIYKLQEELNNQLKNFISLLATFFDHKEENFSANQGFIAITLKSFENNFRSYVKTLKFYKNIENDNPQITYTRLALYDLENFKYFFATYLNSLDQLICYQENEEFDQMANRIIDDFNSCAVAIDEFLKILKTNYKNIKKSLNCVSEFSIKCKKLSQENLHENYNNSEFLDKSQKFIQDIIDDFSSERTVNAENKEIEMHLKSFREFLITFLKRSSKSDNPIWNRIFIECQTYLCSRAPENIHVQEKHQKRLIKMLISLIPFNPF